ncbi:MAG TPA: ferric reductase-like transmembrane domain-containing protein [Streptosporangiaceae bacterium]|nr:ferric reductase-like transmembrane domain-containing protein [Streptosporangiaceae bacterium]
MILSLAAALPTRAEAIVVNSSTPLWYVTRATGLVAMLLLTIGMACGLLSAVGYQRPGLPRFVTLGLHRNATLLALAFTAIHVLTTVTDSYAHIPVQDVFIPFISAYRPLWLGLGTVAFDLLLALTITSLLRSRMSYRTWRVVHWTAYACWPVALLHGLGTGSDTPVRWVLLLTLLCVAVVTALAGWRLAVGWPGRPVARVAGAVALVLALLAAGAWLSAGPLKPGWARRAGTPPTLLNHAAGPLAPRIDQGREGATRPGPWATRPGPGATRPGPGATRDV